MFVSGIVSMFKKIADGREYVLVVPHEIDLSFEPSKRYGIDGVTERLIVFKAKNDQEFTKILNKFVGNLEKPDGGGIVSLLYSSLLTRGLDRY